MSEPEKLLKFEEKVRLDTRNGFIDVVIPETHVLIEQKSIKTDLREPIKQKDGSEITPYQQVLNYRNGLRYDEQPRWIVTCNFRSFLIYDMNKLYSEPEEILLKNLPKEYYRLQFLIDAQSDKIKKEEELSIKAGELVGELYEALSQQYSDFSSELSQKSLNILCVRLVFCLYAEDADLFVTKGAFHDYLAKYPDPSLMRKALIELFDTLDTPENDRDQYADDDLLNFPFVNGGLFADRNIEIPKFTPEIRDLLLAKAADNFDWSQINPTIFGAVFESTLNPDTRRHGGMHYTSRENIHRVIDPLFLDDLRDKLANIKKLRGKKRQQKLQEFQDCLSSLTFLDPACGSGNFLTETYICIRRLENEAIRLMTGGQAYLDEIVNPVKVSINQLYGIEINDFAVSVAKTALWIAESQMLKETEDIVKREIEFLPLKTNDNIFEGNALKIDWNDFIPREKVNYIMGNPPFVGARLMSTDQKNDLLQIFTNNKRAGNLDYVSGWYKKAAEYINNTPIKVAFVSTNSITQGEQVSILWKEIIRQYNINIIFAYRTFVWDSEATDKAHVYCVIIGFCGYDYRDQKLIFDNNRIQLVGHINPYLLNFRNVFIESRQKPLCAVPEIGIGNKPIDGGNYLFTEDEKNEFVKKEPLAEKYFRKWIGSDEFINRYYRWCLWLGDCSPAEIKKMPECYKRVQAVREFRLTSTSKPTQKLADTPTRFHVENFPEDDYLLVPRVSSEKRRYIPIGFISSDILTSDSAHMIDCSQFGSREFAQGENSSLSMLILFGILTSSVHNAWIRAVCGRLKSDYRYSKEIVYNNFPWCNPSDEQKSKIEQTAKIILNTRAKHQESSLADLYDETLMPADLRKAHQENDKAVLKAYDLSPKAGENEILSKLFEMYQELTGQ